MSRPLAGTKPPMSRRPSRPLAYTKPPRNLMVSKVIYPRQTPTEVVGDLRGYDGVRLLDVVYRSKAQTNKGRGQVESTITSFSPSKFETRRAFKAGVELAPPPSKLRKQGEGSS